MCRKILQYNVHCCHVNVITELCDWSFMHQNKKCYYCHDATHETDVTEEGCLDCQNKLLRNGISRTGDNGAQPTIVEPARREELERHFVRKSVRERLVFDVRMYSLWVVILLKCKPLYCNLALDNVSQDSTPIYPPTANLDRAWRLHHGAFFKPHPPTYDTLGADCAICRDQDKEQVVLPCHPTHIVHAHCIEAWGLRLRTQQIEALRGDPDRYPEMLKRFGTTCPSDRLRITSCEDERNLNHAPRIAARILREVMAVTRGREPSSYAQRYLQHFYPAMQLPSNSSEYNVRVDNAIPLTDPRLQNLDDETQDRMPYIYIHDDTQTRNARDFDRSFDYFEIIPDDAAPAGYVYVCTWATSLLSNKNTNWTTRLMMAWDPYTANPAKDYVDRELYDGLMTTLVARFEPALAKTNHEGVLGILNKWRDEPVGRVIELLQQEYDWEGAEEELKR